METRTSPGFNKAWKYLAVCWFNTLVVLALLWYFSSSAYSTGREEKPEEHIPMFLLLAGTAGAWFAASLIYQCLRRETIKKALLVTGLVFPCLLVNCAFIYAGCIFLTWI